MKNIFSYKYYQITEDEMHAYLSIPVKDKDEYDGIIKWIVFRKKHPFISYMLLLITDVASIEAVIGKQI